MELAIAPQRSVSPNRPARSTVGMPPVRETVMAEFAYDHVHLRSPDPDETAAYYERMFSAEIIKSVMSNGLPRTDIRLGGVMFFIAQVPASGELDEKPEGGFVGVDHTRP